MKFIFTRISPRAGRIFPVRFILFALFCALLLTKAFGPAPAPAFAEEPGTAKVYEPSHCRLVLPGDNWRPTGPWATDPKAGEEANGLLFQGDAVAETGETVTDFMLMKFPAISIPSEVFPQMTKAEQAQLCDGLLKNFKSLFAKQFGVQPVASRAMVKRLGGWYTVMLTARFKLGDEDTITNQILYSLPDRVVGLTFYTQTALISVIAEDIAAILENFQPDTRVTPRDLPGRNPGEALDAYIKRTNGPS